MASSGASSSTTGRSPDGPGGGRTTWRPSGPGRSRASPSIVAATASTVRPPSTSATAPPTWRARQRSANAGWWATPRPIWSGRCARRRRSGRAWPKCSTVCSHPERLGHDFGHARRHLVARSLLSEAPDERHGLEAVERARRQLVGVDVAGDDQHGYVRIPGEIDNAADGLARERLRVEEPFAGHDQLHAIEPLRE